MTASFGGEPYRSVAAYSRQIRQLQRTRILSATVQLTCERGIECATVSRIVDRAKVSRTSFYSLFAHRDDCLIAAARHGVNLASDRAHAACATDATWAERLRAGLAAILEFLDEEPELARFSLVQTMATPSMHDFRAEVLARLVAAVDDGRQDERVRCQPTTLAAEGTIFAVLGIVYTRLVGVRQQALVDLLNPLMALIVSPYLGNALASRELSRPVPLPKSLSNILTDAQSVLTELDVRLTYRRLLTLETIAVEPELSNAEIGERVGIHDQGQMSKLLARLAQHDLVANGRLEQAKSTANAWHLTPKGRQVVEATQDVRDQHR